MIRTSDLYSFIESNYEFLMAVDSSETVVHSSRLLLRACGPGELSHEGRRLEQILSAASLRSMRSGMALAKEGQRRLAVFSPVEFPSCEIPLKTGYVGSSEGDGVWVFFGSQLDGINRQTDFDREERIKELACLYAVAEWIEISSDVPEFFTKLPDYLGKGMLYPGQVMVFSSYQGREYGQMPPGEGYISTKLLSNQQIAGEIRVGYANPALELLPEEQRMLSEIGRMLNLALERKELRDRMILRQEEEAAFTRRFAEMQSEIEARTGELELQKTRLDMVNMYLENVDRGWNESSAQLASMFQAIPDDVAVVDLDRNIVMTNREGTSSGKCHAQFFGSDTPCTDCRLSRIRRDKTPIVHTIRSGSRFLEVHAIPVFDRDREVEGIIEFYRDVTLEKTYEQQIQQADKLASLGQLVSGIGHEINNPNQFIRGNIKIIRQALEDILPIVDDYAAAHPDLKVAKLRYDFFRSNILTLVDDMAHGSERIRGIVEGLRNFARKDEGLLVDRVDVNTLIQAASRLVANEIHKHADIVMDLDPGIPTFEGNAQKIEQVIVNLLVNAAQAMPDDRRGTVSVRTGASDDAVVIEVKDDGRGMNEKTLRQIFDPFFTTKRAKGGTGLGLPIAYRIVEEHGGTISVNSTPGVGTVFTVSIPAGPAAPGAAVRAETRTPEA